MRCNNDDAKPGPVTKHRTNCRGNSPQRGGLRLGVVRDVPSDGRVQQQGRSLKGQSGRAGREGGEENAPSVGLMGLMGLVRLVGSVALPQVWRV